MNQGQVLVTRPQPGASETAARLQALGFTPLLAPMLRIVPKPASFPPREAVQAMLITSANALAGIPAGWRSCPIFAVGAATGRHASALGFTQVVSADGDAVALADLAGARLSPERGGVLVVHGEDQGDALCAALTSAGFTLRRAVTYAALPTPSLPEAACAAWRTGAVAAALVFSAETGHALVAAVTRDGLAEGSARILACAISDKAARSISPLPWRALRVAVRPDQESLLALLT